MWDPGRRRRRGAVSGLRGASGRRGRSLPGSGRPAPPRRRRRRRRAAPARGPHGPAAAARRRLPRLHARHVRHRPVGPAPDVRNAERGAHPVPALPGHRREQPELAGVRLPEAGLDADHGEHHRRRAADPLHPGVLLLQPRQAVGAAAEPGAAGGAGRGLLLLQPPDPRRAHAPGAPGALLQRLHHRHVPLAAGRPGQDPPDPIDALPVLPADGHHLPGLRQLDAVRRAAPRPVHHGPQRAGDRHQRPAVLAVLAVPAGAGQALQTSARLSRNPPGLRSHSPRVRGRLGAAAAAACGQGQPAASSPAPAAPRPHLPGPVLVPVGLFLAMPPWRQEHPAPRVPAPRCGSTPPASTPARRSGHLGRPAPLL